MSADKKTVQCPVCWHEETMRARCIGRERNYDDPPLMTWRRPPGGAGGQVVTRWGAGFWQCESCGFQEIAHVVGLMLDAALWCSDPNSDAIDSDTVHADAKRAFRGGTP